MIALGTDTLRELRAIRNRIGRGYELSQADLDALQSDWSPIVCPSVKDVSEQFAIALPDGSVTKTTGPRWMYHLFGLSHRAVEIGLQTPSGLIVLQRRAKTKDTWPDLWDMAVAGHVPADLDFDAGAVKETEEELNLPISLEPELLLDGRLIPVGKPYCCYEEMTDRNPPFHDAEVRQVYVGTLTEAGMAQMKPDFEELGGILICSIERAWDILSTERVAGGMRYSLPRCLDWIEKSGR